MCFVLQGRCVFASGSPFQPVEINGKTLYPGQGNNAYIFPGVALAAISCGVRHIPESIFLKSAQVGVLARPQSRSSCPSSVWLSSFLLCFRFMSLRNIGGGGYKLILDMYVANIHTTY